MLLSDLGATVLRIDRPDPFAHTDQAVPTKDLLARGKSSIALDLKLNSSRVLLKSLLATVVDVLIDPFRPGVLESLDLAPNTLLAANPRLIIARLTGFRRDGKYSSRAGHDINYLGVSGVLSQLGRKDQPPYPPANLMGDFAGGGLACAFGILTALYTRAMDGKGQVVEVNMVDGVSYLATMMRLGLNVPMWDQPRGENYFDGGCPWYDVYECMDGRYMAVGAVEPKFFEELLKGLELDVEWLSRRSDRTQWAPLRAELQVAFRKKTREQWEDIFDHKDACCSPVIDIGELKSQAYDQRHLVHFSKTPGVTLGQNAGWNAQTLAPGNGGERTLKDWMGWQIGKDFEVENGALVKLISSNSKL